MSDPEPQNLNSDGIELPVCPECQSKQAHPSRSAYPKDKEKNPRGTASFWRCFNCGARFLGPLAPERKRRHPDHRDSRDRTLALARAARRWIFPGLVILATIVAVIYVLDQRDTPAPEIIFPDQ